MVEHGRPASVIEDLPRSMPTLFRFLLVVAAIIGIGYGAILFLAYGVNPSPREISVTVPQDRFYKDK